MGRYRAHALKPPAAMRNVVTNFAEEVQLEVIECFDNVQHARDRELQLINDLKSYVPHGFNKIRSKRQVRYWRVVNTMKKVERMRKK